MHIQFMFPNKVQTYETKADGEAWFTRSELMIAPEKQQDGKWNASLLLWNRLRYLDPIKPEESDEPSEEGEEVEVSKGKNKTRRDEGVPETIVEFNGLDSEPKTLLEFFDIWAVEDGLMRVSINAEIIWIADLEGDDSNGYEEEVEEVEEGEASYSEEDSEVGEEAEG